MARNFSVSDQCFEISRRARLVQALLCGYPVTPVVDTYDTGPPCAEVGLFRVAVCVRADRPSGHGPSRYPRSSLPGSARGAIRIYTAYVSCPAVVGARRVGGGGAGGCRPDQGARAALCRDADAHHDGDADRSAARPALFGERVSHAFLPYDTPGAVNRFLGRVRPRLLVVMETEVWPNLFRACARGDIPLVLASARLSQKSVKRFRWLAPLFRDTLDGPVTIAAQTRPTQRVSVRSVQIPLACR